MKNLKTKIEKEFKKNGLNFDKIVRTKMGDGFFIYYNRAMGLPYTSYKKRLVKKNPDGSKLYERIKETRTLHRDFVDCEDMLRMIIAEAKRR